MSTQGSGMGYGIRSISLVHMYPAQTPYPVQTSTQQSEALLGRRLHQLNLPALLLPSRLFRPCTVCLSGLWGLLHHLCQVVVDPRTEGGGTGEQELWERTFYCGHSRKGTAPLQDSIVFSGQDVLVVRTGKQFTVA